MLLALIVLANNTHTPLPPLIIFVQYSYILNLVLRILVPQFENRVYL